MDFDNMTFSGDVSLLVELSGFKFVDFDTNFDVRLPIQDMEASGSVDDAKFSYNGTC